MFLHFRKLGKKRKYHNWVETQANASPLKINFWQKLSKLTRNQISRFCLNFLLLANFFVTDHRQIGLDELSKNV